MIASRAARGIPIPVPSLAIGGVVSAVALASAWFSPLLMPVVAGMALLALAVLRQPWLGLALLIASVPVQQIGAVAGLTATRLALVAALAGFAASLLVDRRPLGGTRFVIPFTALLAWMVLTLVVARDQVAGMAEIFRWTTAFLAFVLAVHFLSGAPRSRVVAFVAVIAVAGALEALAGTVLGLIGFGPESFAVAGSVTRAYGSFGRPNSFAGYLEMSLFPALWLSVYVMHQAWSRLRDYRLARFRGFVESTVERRALLRSLAVLTILGGSAGLMLLGVLLSFSRGAWLGVTAGLAVSGVLALRSRIVVALAVAPSAILLVALALVTIAPSTLTGRLTSIADEARPFDAASIPITPENYAVVERMAHWQAGWHMFEDHVLAGVGTGNYNERYADYFLRFEFRVSQGHAHNFYIHILAETGIVGLILYLTLAMSFLALAAAVALRSTDLMARFVALGAAGTMTAVYTHNLFENLHVLNLGVIISGAWALAVVAHQMWRSVSGEAPTPVNSIDVEYSPR